MRSRWQASCVSYLFNDKQLGKSRLCRSWIEDHNRDFQKPNASRHNHIVRKPRPFDLAGGLSPLAQLSFLQRS